MARLHEQNMTLFILYHQQSLDPFICSDSGTTVFIFLLVCGIELFSVHKLIHYGFITPMDTALLIFATHGANGNIYWWLQRGSIFLKIHDLKSMNETQMM